MPAISEWGKSLRARSDFATCVRIEVKGVPVALPFAGKRKGDVWQRRVSDDVLPDSPLADAPEKATSQILYSRTGTEQTGAPLKKVLEGELAPLAPLFLFQTRGKASFPVAFHILATKAVGAPINSRGFSDRTFHLLMRNDEGEPDVTLMRDVVEYFRAPFDALDLAQETVLRALDPDWDPAKKHQFDPPGPGVKPFHPRAGALLRRDLRRLLDADLPRADVFRHFNRLLALHFGLYQPRLAALLNPAIRALERELATPGTVDVDELVAIEAGTSPAHRFERSIVTQAPAGSWRAMRKSSPAAVAYERLARELNELHFSLLLLNRLRELGRAWLEQHGYDEEGVRAGTRHASHFVKRLRDDEGFAPFLAAALEALALRFIEDQIPDASRQAAEADAVAADSWLSALAELYRRYNREGEDRTKTRSWKHGEGLVRRLLGTGESGLLRTRARAGAYFEIGAQLLPLLLLTTMRPGTDKLAVDTFFDELGQYGLVLEESEREELLRRLKGMGLYERYSDAGAASYVRSILASGREDA